MVLWNQGFLGCPRLCALWVENSEQILKYLENACNEREIRKEQTCSFVDQGNFKIFFRNEILVILLEDEARTCLFFSFLEKLKILYYLMGSDCWGWS